MWKGQYYRLTEHTVIDPPREYSKAVQHGLDIFCRDMTIVFGKEPKIHDTSSGSILRLTYAAKEESLGRPESYQIKFYEDVDQQLVMEISGEDDLGIIYGLLYLVRHI